MAGQRDERAFQPITFGGVLDESTTPSKVGGSGLTACQNLIYRRFGAWGKRAGSGLVYAAIPPPAAPPTPSQPTPNAPAPQYPPIRPPSPPGTPPRVGPNRPVF